MKTPAKAALGILAPVKGARAHLERRVKELAHQMPELEDLTPEQIDRLATAVVVDKLKDDLRRDAMSERVHWSEELERFLARKSPHTMTAYRRALGYLGQWMKKHDLRVLDLTAALADDFIGDLVTGKDLEAPIDADTVRLSVSACSAFFSHLERRFAELRNPFRGTRARPKASPTTAVIPSEAEIGTLQAEADPPLRAALAVVIETGARVGGLPALSIRADLTWYTTSKGKEVQGFAPLSARALKALSAAGLDSWRKADSWQPFDPARFPRGEGRGESDTSPGDLLIDWLKTKLRRLCERLVSEGKIGTVYSFHDLRHAFAGRNVDRGMLWLRDALGHSSISITEKYLRNTLHVDTRSM